MKPRERRDEGEQDLFRSRLDQIIDMNHALVKLARAIDWRFLEDSFGLQRRPRHAAVGDPIDGGLCHSQAHLQPV